PPSPGKLPIWTYSIPVSLKPIHRPLFQVDAARGEGNFWKYRKIIRNDIYRDGHIPHEATIVNWPMNDYFEHNIIDQPAEDVAVHLEEAKQLSLALMYWMQTESPREGARQGYPGLYLRPDLLGTADGLAKAPYF